MRNPYYDTSLEAYQDWCAQEADGEVPSMDYKTWCGWMEALRRSTEPTELEREVARAIRSELNRQHELSQADGLYYEDDRDLIDGTLDVEALVRAAISACFRWQPIETAPKDRPVRAWISEWNMMECAAWFDHGQWWMPVSESGRIAIPVPRYWLPLGQPPEDT